MNIKDVRTAVLILWVFVWLIVLSLLWDNNHPTVIWFGFLLVFMGQLKTKLDLHWITGSVQVWFESLSELGENIHKNLNNKEYRS